MAKSIKVGYGHSEALQRQHWTLLSRFRLKMLVFSALAAALLAASSVRAHATFQDLWVNGGELISVAVRRAARLLQWQLTSREHAPGYLSAIAQ